MPLPAVKSLFSSLNLRPIQIDKDVLRVANCCFLGEDLSAIKLIVADVGDEKSLREMCAQTNVLINCCGPYRLYGEPVVKAAIESKTNYVDITGEPQFMDLMQIRYDDKAREAGVFVISACGFDSIPADMGVTFLKQNFKGMLDVLTYEYN
uniref:SFRICE_017814 n=1 Tax=Spodoptera frugiperda TaxID=7108 RepID=A0A2H1WM84_SPOFR